MIILNYHGFLRGYPTQLLAFTVINLLCYHVLPLVVLYRHGFLRYSPIPPLWLTMILPCSKITASFVITLLSHPDLLWYYAILPSWLPLVLPYSTFQQILW